MFEDDPGENLKHDQESFGACNGIVVFAGNSKASWLQSKKRDILKLCSQAAGRLPEVLYYIGPPSREDKKDFRSTRGSIVFEPGDYQSNVMADFFARIRAGT